MARMGAAAIDGDEAVRVDDGAVVFIVPPSEIAGG
jgi:hypothetical protein